MLPHPDEIARMAIAETERRADEADNPVRRALRDAQPRRFRKLATWHHRGMAHLGCGLIRLGLRLTARSRPTASSRNNRAEVC